MYSYIPCSIAVMAIARCYFILLSVWVWLFIHVALNHVVRLNRDVRHMFGAKYMYKMRNCEQRFMMDDINDDDFFFLPGHKMSN